MSADAQDPSPTGLALDSPSPTATANCPGATPLPSASGLSPATWAEVVTTDLVRRSVPGVAEDSIILGEFNEPARLYIHEGPAQADGFDWYLVEPEAATSYDAGGWVAAAGKDGEEWLRPLPRDDGSWTLLATHDLPGRPSIERAVAGADGRIYVFGGTDGASPSQAIAAAWAFDFATCAWAGLAPMLAPVDHPAVARGADGLLYVIGGYAGDAASASLAAYDPIGDAWMPRDAAPHPVAYDSAVAATPDGRIWTFGRSGTAVYESTNDAWAEAFDASGARGVDDAYATADGDIDLLLTGAGGVVRFDAATSTVTTLGVPLIAYYNATSEPMPDGRILVTGGYPAGHGCTVPEPVVKSGFGPTASLVTALDPESGEWTVLPPLPITVGSGVNVDGHLYVLGLADDDVVIVRYEPPPGAERNVALLESGPGSCGG